MVTPRTWILASPHAGDNAQLLALAGALGWPYEVKRLIYRQSEGVLRFLGQATLAALSDLAGRTGATALWCLGDSFHDAMGCDRLHAEVEAGLRDLTARIDWIWITGNHDDGLTDPFGGRIMAEAVVDGLVLRHEAVSGETRPELSGHFHPKLRVKVRGMSVARRCFVASATKLILPAFGALTGGLDVAHPAIIGAVGADARALVAVEDRLLSFPVAA